jgi:hypothetical protein
MEKDLFNMFYHMVLYVLLNLQDPSLLAISPHILLLVGGSGHSAALSSHESLQLYVGRFRSQNRSLTGRFLVIPNENLLNSHKNLLNLIFILFTFICLLLLEDATIRHNLLY